MASLRGHNVAVPLRTPNLSDVWITYTAKGRTRSNAIARLRPTPQARHPYPGQSHLAHAVISQAIRDATPEKDRGGKPFKDDTRRRRLQCEALLWLCGSDHDLCYWAMLADYPIHNLHQRFRPLLMAFIERHNAVASTFHLPSWTRPCA